MLEDMAHPQPATPNQIYNSTPYGILNNKVNQKRSKAMDVRFDWVKDRIAQEEYHVYWEPVGENSSDYFIKHHSSAHHRSMRSQYVHNKNTPMIRYHSSALKHTAWVC
jgi:hypothetical protein